MRTISGKESRRFWPRRINVRYRRPRSYIPPYNYCDRWCERCAIDKTRCLVYQMEMDDRLHRELDGGGEPTINEAVERIQEDLRRAAEIVQGEARRLGIDLEEAAKKAPPPFPRERDALVEAGMALARGAADFLRAHGGEFPEEAAELRWYHAMVAPKLARATMEGSEEHEVADHILQAQVAHRAAVRMTAALESIREKRPALVDAMLDLLALLQRIRIAIEERWLALPCRLLTAAPDDRWWGPLRDIKETLRQLRRS
jgi:hypothetical protein